MLQFFLLDLPNNLVISNWLEGQGFYLPEELKLSGAFIKGIAQVGILTGIIYFIHCRFVQNSQAEQLLKGVFILLLLFIGLWGMASILQLGMLMQVFAASIQILFIGLIVIFQPELRKILLLLGQGDLFTGTYTASDSQEEKVQRLIQVLSDTVHFLSKSKRGALIVLESFGDNTTDANYLEVGTILDANLSTELMLTIFHQNTPLHDGAVVINTENRLIAAGVLLPLTEDPKLSWQYGTRHRAAIGLTEISDSLCVVVSEETGNISLVKGGGLEKVNGLDDFGNRLQLHFNVNLNPGNPKKSLDIPQKISGFFSRTKALKLAQKNQENPKK
ncbi:MAG: diadenylate cyclase CdaA [Cyanobacteria bacterium P01_H01_bin.74]